MQTPSSRRLQPGQQWFMVAAFFLFMAAVMAYVASEASARWQRLHENGTKVTGVVSEKHGLPADLEDLWSRTSVAARYPNSVVLFDDWGARLWSDFPTSDYATIEIGQEIELRIDGNESLAVLSDDLPPFGWTECIVAAAIGLLLVSLGIRSRNKRRQESGQDLRGGRGRAMVLGGCLLASVAATSPVSAQAPPHIVIILADDLGWTDLSTGRTNGGNGSPYHKTPNLDALAAAGVCFPNAYSNGPNCAPTRAALWSGQWAARTGIYTVGGGNRGKAQHRKLDAAANNVTLAPSSVTLAETLQAAGFTTGHFGKWHLGGKAKSASPTDQGFDHQAGGDQRGGVGRVGHFADQQGAFAVPGLPANGKAQQFMADRLTDEALQWMSAAKQPIFCCLSHYSVHTPIAAPPEDLRATPKAEDGSRHQHRRYAAMMKNLDDNCGRVMQFLAETDDPVRKGQKLLANTLIVFTSDNGGLGGYRAAGIPGGQEITNQLPLRSGKGSLHEGGTRVPFIARWDGHVTPGSVDATQLQLLDLYPTLAAIAGAKLTAGHALDGVDLSGRLRIEPQALAERALFWHFPGYLQANSKAGTWRTTPAACVRLGDLKAMFWFETRTWSLFDLAADIGEADDLARTRPDDLRALAAELRAWLVATKAPMPSEVGGGPVALPDLPE